MDLKINDDDLQIDSEERMMTEAVSEMVRSGMISINNTIGCFSAELGPRGQFLAQGAGALINAITERTTWDRLREERTWRGFINVVVDVATKLIIENIDLMVRLALRLAQFIQKILQHSSARHSLGSLVSNPPLDFPPRDRN